MSESTRVLNGGGGVASGHHDNNIIVDGWKRVAHINMKALEQVKISLFCVLPSLNTYNIIGNAYICTLGGARFHIKAIGSTPIPHQIN